MSFSWIVPQQTVVKLLQSVIFRSMIWHTGIPWRNYVYLRLNLKTCLCIIVWLKQNKYLLRASTLNSYPMVTLPVVLFVVHSGHVVVHFTATYWYLSRTRCVGAFGKHLFWRNRLYAIYFINALDQVLTERLQSLLERVQCMYYLTMLLNMICFIIVSVLMFQSMIGGTT